MKQNIKEELNYMKYLFGYKKGVVISEQVTSPNTQGGDGCVELPQIISPSFANSQADHTKFVTPVLDELKKAIANNPALKGGTITKMEIIGGASNVDGGKVTSFSLTNDYTPVEPKNTNDTGYQNNIGYATKRGELAKTTLLPILTGADYGLKIDSNQVVVTPAVIDTGGVQDTNSKRKPNPGQIVIIKMTVCPAGQQQKGTDIDISEELMPLYECFNGLQININYDRDSTDQSHECNSAVWDITANGIPLYRTSRNNTKVKYASLNNVSDPRVLDPYDDAISQGLYRYNNFRVDQITAKEFVNSGSLSKYKGNLNIFMKCQVGVNGEYGLPGHSKSNGGCHTGTASIQIIPKEGVAPTKGQVDPPVVSGDERSVYTVEACKPIYQKLVSSGAIK